MKTKAKFCIDCGKEGTVGRRRCTDCFSIYNRNRVKEYYNEFKILGKKRSRYGKINCCICNEEMIKNRPNQVAHGKCKKHNVVSYNGHPRDEKGMMVGRGIIINLGLNLSRKIIVHHIDENPTNKKNKNLMIMSTSIHGKIHGFLREQRIINKGIYGEKLDSIWKKILIKLNYVWIEKNNIQLIIIDYKSDLKKIEIKSENIYMIKK